ncbi:unnamed protein product [Moneuplotes crassus]|uniref:Uncharacterized protein n=1 Tax=Euplotes crassus TaxID=5936 RepID=A0AAD1Y1R5_EUPCR|nr:unnamed protein product [Moneuplotes crassus]
MNLDQYQFPQPREINAKKRVAHYWLRFFNILSILVQVFVSMKILRELDHSEIFLVHVLSILWSLIYHLSPPYGRSPLFITFSYVICSVSFCATCFNALQAMEASDNFAQLMIIVITLVLTLPALTTSLTLILLIFYENEEVPSNVIYVSEDMIVTTVQKDDSKSQIYQI